MKINDFLKLTQSEKNTKRRKPRQEERTIQISCVSWFRYTYPQFLIFSVPNGGSRNGIEALNLKKEGALAGVSDLIAVANHKVLFIEMKKPKGKQQQTQKDFQCRVEALGFDYVVCYGLDDFIAKINKWLCVK